MEHAAPYDLTPYAHVWDFPPASVDRRHLFWMYDVLSSGQFQNALEIGCFYGASSTAFVEAINRGHLATATFCDIKIHPHLRHALDQCRFPDRIRIFEGRSVDLLRQSEKFDFVFVDGDHHLETVQAEVELLIGQMPDCLMAHDTNAQAAGFPDCDGPPLLKWRFQTHPSYACLEDAAQRSHELTHRGMFLATKSPIAFATARNSLKSWGALPSLNQIQKNPKDLEGQ